MQNYFELFGLKTEFEIDLTVLENSYQTQMAQFHPDKFATADATQKSQALQNTALLNTAFNTLKSPLTRTTYLLELQNINPFDEKDTTMDLGFLDMIIELRKQLETIEAQQNTAQLDDFISVTQTKLKDNINQIKQSFTDKNLTETKNLVRELKFYKQLNTQANQLMDEWL